MMMNDWMKVRGFVEVGDADVVVAVVGKWRMWSLPGNKKIDHYVYSHHLSHMNSHDWNLRNVAEWPTDDVVDDVDDDEGNGDELLK